MAEAIEALSAALTLRTKSLRPVGWAKTKENLAILEVHRVKLSRPPTTPRPAVCARILKALSD